MQSLKKHLYNPWAIVLSFLSLLAILFVVLWILIPPLPKKIEMATGFPTGLYYQFGERLQAELSKERVELKVKATGGTLEEPPTYNYLLNTYEYQWLVTHC